MLAQAAGVVVGAKGTLPPRGDTSELPPELRERVDVVGKQEELSDLLAQVAAKLTK